MKKYIAEAIGTFGLAFVVLVGIATGNLLLPILAGITLGLFVYTIGPISGSHINPAVTLGAWTIRKIDTKEGIGYIIAQIIGGLLAVFIAKNMGVTVPDIPAVQSSGAFIAEALGAAFFTFGIASVIYGKVNDIASGLVIGGSLLLGIMIASAGSLGVLNPAVAIAVGVSGWAYICGPLVGAFVGMGAYRLLLGRK